MTNGRKYIEGPSEEGRVLLSEPGMVTSAEEGLCATCSQPIYRIRCEGATDLYGGSYFVAYIGFAPCWHYPVTPRPTRVSGYWQNNYNATAVINHWYRLTEERVGAGDRWE